VPVRSGSPPPVEDDRPDPPFGVWGLRSWASSDRTGAGRGSWCQDGSGVDEPSEVGGEADSGCTVDDVVVDRDGEVKDVSHLDAVADGAGTFATKRGPARSHRGGATRAGSQPST
jgi:hypothetical protein